MRKMTLDEILEFKKYQKDITFRLKYYSCSSCIHVRNVNSISGTCTKLGRNLVDWVSKKYPFVKITKRRNMSFMGSDGKLREWYEFNMYWRWCDVFH